MIPRAASNKSTGFWLPYLGLACHSTAPHCSKTTNDYCDCEGLPPSIPTTCPLIIQTIKEGSKSAWLIFVGVLGICDSIAISPFTWPLKSQSFNSRQRQRKSYSSQRLHSCWGGEGGTSLSNRSPDLELRPSEGAQPLRVLSTRESCPELCPRGVIHHCTVYSGRLKCIQGCPSQRPCVPS